MAKLAKALQWQEGGEISLPAVAAIHGQQGTDPENLHKYPQVSKSYLDQSMTVSS